MVIPEDEKPYQDFLEIVREKFQPAKASFYTLEVNGMFRLRAQFGFSRTDRLAERMSRMDPLPTQVYEHREPFYVNNIRQAGKLADVMEASSSTRILTAPLYLEGRLVGILDVRDKPGRALFTHDDLLLAADLMNRFSAQLRRLGGSPSATETVEAEMELERPLERSPGSVSGIRSGIFAGSAYGVSSYTSPSVRLPSEAELEAVSRPAPEPPPTAGPDLGLAVPSAAARAVRLVEERLSRAASARVPVVPTPGTAPREVEFLKLYLASCLQFPDIEIAATSVVLPNTLEVTLASRRPVDTDVEPALLENLERIFAKSAARFPLPQSPVFRPLEPPAPEGRPVKRAEIAAIQSSVLAGTPEALLAFSLLFRHGPAPEGREALRNVHVVLKNALAEIRSESRYREAYRGLVNRLIEPGLKYRTALKTHSYNVGRLARRFATQLGMSAADVEQITVAAILHDVGMRELSYDELYSRKTLTEEELKLLRQHPRVGAFIVEEVPWPYPIAPLVKHHHERWDGAGYPDGLRGEQIPPGSRIIHLCEAFDAMTSPTSYRPVLSDYQALDILVSKAGTQFDPDLAPSFKKMVEGPSE